MNNSSKLSSAVVAIAAITAFSGSTWAATTIQIGSSGNTYASSAVQCAADPGTGASSPVVEAGLFNPTTRLRATVTLNGTPVASVTTLMPSANVWLADGNNNVVVALNKRTVDRYTFTVQPGICSLPDTSGNTFSADGTLEYAASEKSYATVTPGCAWNADTSQAQPYVNLFANGEYLLNVSVNGVPLTQLSTTYPHTPVFLSAGQNVISAANGYLSVDYFVRDGGDGTCSLP
jgi:hypothetical protein